MHSSLFYKLFPPPRFMVMKHAGLDISDDAIRCIEYRSTPHGKTISKFASVDLPPGVIEGGDIKDSKTLATMLTAFDKEHDLGYARVSLPEEKAYLFQTDVTPGDMVSIAQNIEFKLEDNVPLSAADAVFYMDLLPATVTGSALKASVSVVPKSYVEQMIGLLRTSGIIPVAFEIIPKSIARAVISPHDDEATMIIYIMNRKTGIYIVSGGVVCFTSTIAWGGAVPGAAEDVTTLVKEINRIYTYWMSHSLPTTALSRMILVGKNAPTYESSLRTMADEVGLTISIADVWHNAFSLDQYLPPVTREESLDYAVSAGLALDL